MAFIHAAFSALRPGVPVLCLHGRQKQMKRLAVYTEFCAKKHAVLFATDVAARGLDFPTVSAIYIYIPTWPRAASTSPP